MNDMPCMGADSLPKLYEKIHPYCAIVVCVFGTIANVLTVIVLTRKEMARAPINRILKFLAVTDVILMVEYIPYICYRHFQSKVNKEFPYWEAVLMVLHAHLSQVLHLCSVCLTLTLAVWRFLALAYPERYHILCADYRCTIAIILSYVIPIVLCAPQFASFEITTVTIEEDGKNIILYKLDLAEPLLKDQGLFQAFCWMYSVIIKLIPCFILTVITTWLIVNLLRAKQRKKALCSYEMSSLQNNEAACAKFVKCRRRCDRTTKMLIAVLLLFLIMEVPQGIFVLVIALKGMNLFQTCYQRYGDIMDILALFNGAVNFILYCCMNKMFRTTFGQIFHCWFQCLLKKTLLKSNETNTSHTTYV